MHIFSSGNVQDILPVSGDSSFDACFCDPPYGLEFMGSRWDHAVPGVEIWREVLRVLKPGAMLLAFGGTRTVHRLTCAIEDAGFEVRDCLMWLYGTGFPKSMMISRQMDKSLGEDVNEGKGFNRVGRGDRADEFDANGRTHAAFMIKS